MPKLAPFIFFLAVLAPAQGDPLLAAFEARDPGARSSALSGSDLAVPDGAFSTLRDPAGIALLQGFEAQTAFVQPFSISGVSQSALAVAAPVASGSLGMGFTRFGSGDYLEQDISASCAAGFSGRFFAGARVRGMFLRIPGMGSASAFGLDLGTLAVLGRNFRLAAQVRNLNRPSMGRKRESLPSGLEIGAALEPAPGLWLTAGTAQMGPGPASFRTGTEFILSDFFRLRGGFHEDPPGFSAGFGAGVRNASAGRISLDYSFSQGGGLSGSHHFSLAFRFDGRPRVSTPESRPDEKPRLDRAALEDLVRIRGIGRMTAAAILTYRDRFGIRRAEDLLKVPGMKRNVFFKLRESFSFGEPP